MGARHFSPDTGRFLQGDMYEDALGDLGLSEDPLTRNRYALAGGNPISYVETDGHEPASSYTDQRAVNYYYSRRPPRRQASATPDATDRNDRPAYQQRTGAFHREAVAQRTVQNVIARNPLKVPDPHESAVDRLFGRDYITPEEAAARGPLEGNSGNAITWIGRNVLGIGKSKPGASRTTLAPGGGLATHEGRGLGHTLARHVGLSDDALRARLAKVPRASSFYNRAIAEDAVGSALQANNTAVQLFLRSGQQRAVIRQTFDRPIGRTIARGDAAPEDVKTVEVVLFRDSSKIGYHVRTSFPGP